MKVGYPRGRSLADGGGTVLYENVLANHGKLWDAKPGAEGRAPPGAALCSTGCSANRRKRRDATPEAKGRETRPMLVRLRRKPAETPGRKARG